jgi:hypothetical protein
MKDPAPDKRGLNIGLHAQTLERDDGVIAGSEVTTFGLMKALEGRSGVFRVTRYGPGNYGNLDKDDLDLLVIEGWNPALPNFIRRIRNNHSRIKILFWNLSFFGIREIVKLDVDGYLTNSKKLVQVLESIAPTRFVMLAANPKDFRPLEPEQKYLHNVAYLGMFHRAKSHKFIERILYEALEYGLVIYGTGWDQHPVLKDSWRGILPFGDIPKLYSSAKIVLGITEDRQRAAGMINNRVFEALSCGACFLSEYYPALEDVFGDTILYSRKNGDTIKYIEKLLGDASCRKNLGTKGRELILSHHKYEHRMEEILNFFWYIKGYGT